MYCHHDIKEGGDRILLKFLGEVIKGIAQMPSELRNTDARSKGQGDHSKLVNHASTHIADSQPNGNDPVGSTVRLTR